MGLSEYQRKRHFSQTPEPQGASVSAQSSATQSSRTLFVVQKHAASRLHYDFRLEIDGVLKSWAVPKGPSLDPRQKRLAVAVEDHPLAYGDFEGTIPAGQYGGGTVLLWDRGEWQPLEGSATEALRQGLLKFQLRGEKLRGNWMLVRMRATAGEADHNWLLVKERDEFARPLAQGDVLAELPNSVASGRSLEEIAAHPTEPKSVREPGPPSLSASSAKGPKAPQPATTSKKLSRKNEVFPARSADGAKLPDMVELQLATLAAAVPEGGRWFHEIKLDGYRLLCRIADGHVRFITRGQLDWTDRFAALAAAALTLPVTNAILDGEVVALLANGISSFHSLQSAFAENRADRLVYFVFDLLFLDGVDLRRLPLEARKARLAELLSGRSSGDPIRFNDHIAGEGREFLQQCCQMGLEGIISKRRDRPYSGKRTADWLKIKCVQREEFVIGGFTEPTASRKGLGALLVGYYNPAGELIHVGRVGTGFSASMLLDLRKRLDALEQPQSPFANLKRSPGKETHWVRPELVAQVEFGNWTPDGILRHPAFQGLREDKPARDVTREDSPTTQDRPEAPGIVKTRKSSPSHPQILRTGTAGEVQLAGVRLTHPDRLLYADLGITKAGLAEFYVQVADWILPHVTGRPLSLVRCPQGEGKKCFYQKHATPGITDHLRRVTIAGKRESAEYLVIDDMQGLLSLVQMGVLEIHPWGCRADDVEKPDRLIFDLDPDAAVPWTRVIAAARMIREKLAEFDLLSFVKTTGGKGLHVCVPLQRRQTWTELMTFAKGMAEQIRSASPGEFTTNMSKAARPNRIYLDFVRNQREATAVAAYSTRARPGAPISVPIAWHELSPSLHSDHFHVGNLPGRLAGLKRDPWAEFFKVRQWLSVSRIAKLQLK